MERSRTFFFFLRLFVQQIPSQRPVILLCDGYFLHYTPQVISGAPVFGVIVIFAYPPSLYMLHNPLTLASLGLASGTCCPRAMHSWQKVLVQW